MWVVVMVAISGLSRKESWRLVGCDIVKQREKGYIISDALYLPLKSDSIDVVFSNCVLEHMKDSFIAMNELERGMNVTDMKLKSNIPFSVYT